MKKFPVSIFIILSLLATNILGLEAGASISSSESFKQYVLTISANQPSCLKPSPFNNLESTLQAGFKHYIILANQNNPLAQYYIGLAYAYNIGTNYDLDKAIFWLAKAEKNNDGNAMYQLGLLYNAKAHITESTQSTAQAYQKQALNWLTLSAKSQNLQGLLTAAYFYYHGIGTNINKKKALHLIYKASLIDSQASNLALAELYLHSQEPEEVKQAVNLYLKTIKTDRLNYAQLRSIYSNRSYIYKHGINVKQSSAKSTYWNNKYRNVQSQFQTSCQLNNTPS